MSPLTKMSIAVLCVVAFASLAALASSFAEQPEPSRLSADDEERLPMDEDGPLFLAGNECGPDEYLAQGILPTCEPTCKNPRPACPKIYYNVADYVPCFCKSPLVRNEETKQCVPPNKCPPATKPVRDFIAKAE